MPRSSQHQIWNFVTRYRGATGESLSYIRLMEDGDYRRRALDQARRLADPELSELAAALERSLAPEPPAASPRPDAAPWADPVATPTPQPGVQVYEEALIRALAGGEITVSERESLDRTARVAGLDGSQALAVERRLRERLGHPQLHWPNELRASLELLLGPAGLADRERLRLYHTYVRRGRLSAAQAEEMLAAAGPPEPGGAAGRQPPALMLGMSAAALVLMGAMLGFVWLQPLLIQAGAEDDAATVAVTGSIRTDTTWRSGRDYLLQGPVFVERGSTLTVEPGVRVLGEFGSALVVTRGARLLARGRPDRPIVFTSAQPAGTRRGGDWGGVVLLGEAPVNLRPAQIEGIAPNDRRGAFGGNLPAGGCGVLEYVRIEFAGHEVFQDNELNGLTLGGCGSGTVLRYIQVHRALDDGIEFFGGTANLQYALVTGPGDDGLDWQLGWTGSGQFLIVQQYPEQGDSAIEADNRSGRPDAEPRSAPRLYNLTLVGSGAPDQDQRGMVLRRGTAGTLRNLLVTGFPLEAIDLRDAATAAQWASGGLSLAGALITDIGPGGERYFLEEYGEADDDAAFDEATAFAASPGVRLGAPSGLPREARSLTAPVFVPAAGAALLEGAQAPPQGEFWDERARFLGALRPGAESSWLEGWTAYPEN